MDSINNQKLNHYRDIIERIISEYAAIPALNSKLQSIPVFDRIHDQYLLMLVGREERWVHACIIHISIIDGKCWLMRDNTDAVISDELHDMGVSADDIVIGFQPEELRHLTGYALK